MISVIKAFIRSIFYKAPIVGKIYIFDDWEMNKNPFIETYHRKVEILDVKKGWVKFKVIDVDPKFSYENSLERSSFWFCYKADE